MRGTPGYIAPESDKDPLSGKCIYSFKADVYALGVMLLNDLDIFDTFITQMLEQDSAKRIDLPTAILNLCCDDLLQPKHFASLHPSVQAVLTRIDQVAVDAVATSSDILAAIAKRCDSDEILAKIETHPNAKQDGAVLQEVHARRAELAGKSAATQLLDASQQNSSIPATSQSLPQLLPGSPLPPAPPQLPGTIAPAGKELHP